MAAGKASISSFFSKSSTAGVQSKKEDTSKSVKKEEPPKPVKKEESSNIFSDQSSMEVDEVSTNGKMESVSTNGKIENQATKQQQTSTKKNKKRSIVDVDGESGKCELIESIAINFVRFSNIFRRCQRRHTRNTTREKS